MKRKKHLIFALLATLCITPSAFAESKRVEVYSLSQNYWDTQSGETLSQIAAQLLPQNPHIQQKLMADIVVLNPDAFKNNNPDRMMADIRLWLPNNLPQAKDKARTRNTHVEAFSWGNIKRPVR